MADPTASAEPPPAPAKKRQKWMMNGESVIGNFWEMVLTYGFSFFIFLPVNAFLIFGPLHFELAEQKARFWPIWIFFLFMTLGANVYASIVGSQAKFSTKAFRLLADNMFSLSPLLLPVVMVLAGPIFGQYAVDGVDVEIAVFSVMFVIVDIAIAYLVHTAIRRVHEFTGEKG